MRRSIGMLVVCCAVAGCGGDDPQTPEDESVTEPAAAAEVTTQDARAKAGARILQTYVESCYVGNQDYAQCTTEDQLGAGTDVILGSEPGQVEVTDASASGYTVTAHSESGNTYTIVKGEQGSKRSCEAATESSSCANGTW